MCEGGADAARAPHDGAVDPGDAALRLEAAIAFRPEGETRVTLALAELWYRAALRQPHHDSTSFMPRYSALRRTQVSTRWPELSPRLESLVFDRESSWASPASPLACL